MTILAEGRQTTAVAELDDDHPVSLHRIMQTMVGEGLRAHYQPPQKLSHELFVLLLQLKEKERKRERAARSRR